MPTRGSAIKRDTPTRQVLLRPMVTRRYELDVDHEKCCGCRICATVCPRQAIQLTPAQLAGGRVITRPRVDIDEKLCSFCGECVALCPVHALDMRINDVPEIPVVKGEAFPLLLRTMQVQQEACRRSTDLSYVENCPTGAISVQVERDAQGTVVAVQEVDVDRRKCVNCTRCMEEGPAGGFTVTKPFQGRVIMNVALCPPGCQACVDICPTHTITYDGHQVVADRRFCLFCGACENVCPVEGAVRVRRSAILHTPIESGAWMNALDKLVSFREVVREYDVKRQERRRKLIQYELGGEAAAANAEAENA